MKKILITAMAAAALTLSANVYAQDRDSVSTDYNNNNTIDRDDHLEDDADEAENRLREGVDETGDDVEQGADEAGQKLREDADQAGDELRRTRDEAQEGYDETRDKTVDSVNQTTEDVQRNADQINNQSKQHWNNTREDMRPNVDSASTDINNDVKKSEDEMQQDMSEAVDTLQDASGTSEAEREKAADKMGRKVEKRAAKIQDQMNDDARSTSEETKNSGSALMRDEITETKAGPNGQVIYKNDDNTYYYFNAEGDKVAIDKSEMKDKNDNK